MDINSFSNSMVESFKDSFKAKNHMKIFELLNSSEFNSEELKNFSNKININNWNIYLKNLKNHEINRSDQNSYWLDIAYKCIQLLRKKENNLYNTITYLNSLFYKGHIEKKDDIIFLVFFTLYELNEKVKSDFFEQLMLSISVKNYEILFINSLNYIKHNLNYASKQNNQNFLLYLLIVHNIIEKIYYNFFNIMNEISKEKIFYEIINLLEISDPKKINFSNDINLKELEEKINKFIYGKYIK